MLCVRDLMTSDIVAVAPELTLRNTMELLAQRHISGAPVLAGSRLVGVVSASDLLSFQASNPCVPSGHPEEVEQGEIEPTGEWEEGLEAPAAYFSELWEDAGADVLERLEETEGPEWDALQEHTTAEVMSRSICSVGPETGIAEAAGFMLTAGIHRLLVVEGEKLLGILTTMDIVRAVAAHQLK
jgi:CBS domain-containing protein